MADLKRLIVYFGADISNLKKGLLEIQRSIKKAFGRDTIEASRNLGYAISGVAAALGIFSVKAVIANEQLTREKRSFDALTGSAEKTRKLLAQIEEASSRGIFKDADLRKYAKSLLVMGYNTEQIIPLLQAASEAAAATGAGTEGLEKIIDALATIRARGVLTQRSMMTLIKAGLPAWDILAEAIGTTVPEAMKRLKDGTLSSGAALEALIKGMGEKYKGSMARIHSEISVSYIKTMDSLHRITETAGAKITKALGLEKRFKSLAEAVERFSNTFKTAGFQKALNELIDPKIQIGIYAVAGAITAALIPSLLSAATAAIAAMIPLWPFLLIGAAIAGTAALIYFNWNEVKLLFSALWVSMETSGKLAALELKETFVNFGIGVTKIFSALFYFIPKIGDKAKALRNDFVKMRWEIQKEKAKSLDDYADKLGEIDEEYKKAATSAKTFKDYLPTAEDFKATIDGLNIMQETTDKLEKGTEHLGATFSDAIADIILGTKTATEALKDLASQMARLFIKTGLEAMLGAIGGGTAASATAQGVAAVGELPGYATGAFVRGPQIARIAETEPEYIVPQSKAAGFAAAIAGGGSVSIQNTIINNASNQVTATTETKKDGDKIILNTVINAIATNKNGFRNILKGATA